jgi:hypothetical protein
MIIIMVVVFSFLLVTLNVVFTIIGDHHCGYAFVFFVGDIDHGHALFFYW